MPDPQNQSPESVQWQSQLQPHQDYNFDILKIDMSLVRQIETNPKSRSILKSIIAMAHELGMQLVAEGAETEEQIVIPEGKRL